MFTAPRTVNRRRAAAALAAACLSLSATPALAADTVGDTQAEFGKHVSVQQPRIGDTPAEFGKSVATPHYVEVVKPERTIIRDTDPELPIVLSGLALLVAFGGVALARRSVRVH